MSSCFQEATAIAPIINGMSVERPISSCCLHCGVRDCAMAQAMSHVARREHIALNDSVM
jgi:hypothetical protein